MGSHGKRINIKTYQDNLVDKPLRRQLLLPYKESFRVLTYQLAQADS